MVRTAAVANGRRCPRIRSARALAGLAELGEIPIASEKARNGNMAAVSFLAARHRMSARRSASDCSSGWGPVRSELIVLDALKALGPRPARREREMVAAALRKSGDSEVLALFGLGRPIYEREGWERLKDLALGADSSGFTGVGFVD
jgi:hypothetical protein